MEDCVNFVPFELADDERTSPETIELGKILRNAHVPGAKVTPESYMDVIYYFN